MVIDSHGARISYQAAGNGPAVLSIQGVGVMGNGWLPQAPELTDDFRMITSDSRGVAAGA